MLFLLIGWETRAVILATSSELECKQCRKGCHSACSFCWSQEGARAQLLRGLDTAPGLVVLREQVKAAPKSFSSRVTCWLAGRLTPWKTAKCNAMRRQRATAAPDRQQLGCASLMILTLSLLANQRACPELPRDQNQQVARQGNWRSPRSCQMSK